MSFFAISLGTTLPSHDVPPFSIATGYHKEIKPDAGMLQMDYKIDMLHMGHV